MFKKIAIWGAIVAACVAGLAGLVYLADKSGSSNSTPVETANFPGVSENDIIVGDPKAQIIITEYADFQCPACASQNPNINRILSEYDGKVKIVYRFFPLRGIHKNALISGQAGYAAWKLEKFSEMKDMLYDKQADWENLGDPKEVFEVYAKEIGLMKQKMQLRLEKKKHLDWDSILPRAFSLEISNFNLKGTKASKS